MAPDRLSKFKNAFHTPIKLFNSGRQYEFIVNKQVGVHIMMSEWIIQKVDD